MSLRASRRQFLRAASAIAATGIAQPFALDLAAMASASAQSATDYRALVCIYLAGGNDFLNTYVPYDTDGYDAYASIRGDLALPRATLLPVKDPRGQGGRMLAFRPEMTNIRTLQDAGRAAVVANVGPLLQPTTKARIMAGKAVLPPLLASHVDQQATWLSLATNAPAGWAGRMGDVLAAGNGKAAFTTISATGGSTLWLAGHASSPFTVSGAGGPDLFFTPGSPFDAVAGQPGMRTNLLEKVVAGTFASLRDNATALNAAIVPAAHLPAPQANNALAQQLQTVARIIGGAGPLGARRQIFYLELGGFDMHDGLATRHPALMKQLDDAIGYFDTALTQLGKQPSVTLFTMSEFGRNVVPNDDGTDHAWGSHHLVTGGAVTGGVRGIIPDVDIGSPDILSNGFMLPTTAVEQYAATLGRWMGLSDGQVRDILPNLSRFGPADLGLFA